MNASAAPSVGSRRAFIRNVALGGAVALSPQFLKAAGTAPRSDIAFLEKWFFDGGEGRDAGRLKYSPDEMAQTCDEIGLDLELTVRKHGHITPHNAPDELPRMVEALAKRNRRILFIALDTVRADEPDWVEAIRTARRLGIKQYRHRGFQYDATRPLKTQIADFNRIAKEFAAVNREVGIQALYQTHAGPNMAGGAGWDLDLILDGIDPRDFAVAFDTRHIRVEQGQSWPNVVRLLAPRIACLCVKDFVWQGDKPVAVPFGHGIVSPKMVDAVLAAHGGPLPICIHNEYAKLAPVPFADRAGIVQSFRNDAQVLRRWLAAEPA